MTMTDTQVTQSLNLIELKPGLKFSEHALKSMLPTIKMALFFGKVFDLDAGQLGRLLRITHDTDVVNALLAEEAEHSSDLQDYFVELGYESLLFTGQVTCTQPPIPDSTLLAQLFESSSLTIATSIKEVAEKLKNVVGGMPGKQGEMVFKSMMMVNARRPVIGDYRATIQHGHQPDNLVILDVSGSMTEHTVATIIDDVVALAYMANAHLAIVSDTSRHWEPGTFDTASVLAEAEYGGTHYETLAGLFDRNWGVVVTIADYDSSYSAKWELLRCTGEIEQLLDISLVPRPTYLSEVLGHMAREVKPLLVADRYLTY